MKRILTLLVAIAMSFAYPNINPVSAEDYATGLIADSEETIQSHLIDYGPSYETVLPSSVDLTDEFPTPSDQGSQNSCVGWAIAYALKSHQEETNRQWGLDTDEHLFSPSYIYNQLCGGNDNGISISLALDLVQEQGVCTLASFPYIERDHTTQPTDEQRQEAACYAAPEWHTIHGIDSIKQRLYEGDGVIIGIDLYSDFYNISETDPVYDILYGSAKGSHAVCLIGYDDKKQCYGGTQGAFKFINSWGADWGLDGYGWISYDMMSYSEVGGGYGYILDVSEPMFYENDFQYTIENGSAEIKRYISSGTNVNIPKTLGGCAVGKIGIGAFKGCGELTNVTIPDTVTELGDSAFSFCGKLEDITIPDSVAVIGAGVFSQCTSLKTVFIGSGAKELGADAFGRCTALERIDVHTDNESFMSDNGILFDKAMKTLIKYPTVRAGAYAIPDSVEEIGNGAFIYCDNLTDIYFPSSVRRIGDYAFCSCNALTSIILPDGVEEIGDGAFTVCWNLKKLVLPDSVYMIGIDICMFPGGGSDTVVYCNAGTYAHEYADENCPRYVVSMSVPTFDGGMENITISVLAGYYFTLSLDDPNENALFLAVHDNEELKKVYVSCNGEIADVNRNDVQNGKVFIWDSDMRPFAAPVRDLVPTTIGIWHQ